jgi:hypothetical protein
MLIRQVYFYPKKPGLQTRVSSLALILGHPGAEKQVKNACFGKKYLLTGKTKPAEPGGRAAASATGEGGLSVTVAGIVVSTCLDGLVLGSIRLAEC